MSERIESNLTDDLVCEPKKWSTSRAIVVVVFVIVIAVVVAVAIGTTESRRQLGGATSHFVA